MIADAPDLAVFAHGLTTRLRARVPSSLAAQEQAIRETRVALPQALVVLAGPYWNLQHDAERFAPREGRGPRRATTSSPRTTRRARSWTSAMRRSTSISIACWRGTTWLPHADTVHFADFGQAVIGMTMFAELAVRCSFLVAKSADAELQLRSSGYAPGPRRR
jgi:hypothetical protein